MAVGIARQISKVSVQYFDQQEMSMITYFIFVNIVIKLTCRSLVYVCRCYNLFPWTGKTRYG